MGLSRRKKMMREAELKKKSLELKHEKIFGSVPKKKVKEFIPLKETKAYRRDLPEYASSNAVGSVAAKKEKMEYDGDYIVGIAGMHKSNFVPVGKGDCPESYAKMRRG